MQHSHYDLDRVERETRAMYKRMRDEPVPSEIMDNPSVIWQHSKEAEDIMVAAIRFGLTMDMQGVDFGVQLALFGIVAADMVGGICDQGEIEDYMHRLTWALQGFQAQINQRAEQAHAGTYDAAMAIVKEPSGTA